LKSVLRTTTLLVLLTLLVLFGAGCGQQYQFPDNLTIADVQKMEATDPDKALAGYSHLKNRFDGKDSEQAAQALLLSAQFASDPNRYGTMAQIHADRMTPEVTAALEEKHDNGDRQAHEALKQLQDQYPSTAAARAAEEKTYGPTHNLIFQEFLEKRIDQRNSSKFSYQLIDGLVAATGRVPGFSYWFALMVIALAVKFLTLPLMLRSYKSQREMQRLQPMLKELEEKYKGKPELNEKKMQFFKEHNVNPAASCLPMLVQMPFMIWIYNTIRLYEFHFANGKFLWIGSALSHRYHDFLATDLAKFDFPLLILYIVSMYLTMKLTPVSDPQQAQMQKQSSIMMTAMMFWMFTKYRWPGAFIFYWLILNIVSAWQQYTYIYKPRKAETVAPPTPPIPPTGGDKGKGNRNGSGNALATANSVTPMAGGSKAGPRPRKKRPR
jgi:YidC/Oxa1 family membrane protein insertase